MSAFTKKLNQIKESFASDYGLKKPVTISNYNSVTSKRIEPAPSINRVKSLSRCEIKVSSPQCKQENYLVRQPVIIQTKNSRNKSQSNYSSDVNRKYSSVKKTVQPFVPIVIPTRDRSSIRQQIIATQKPTLNNRQIQIIIQKDQSQSKQCLQKLFKKIHTLQQQLVQSQKQRHKLQIEVDHLRKRNKQCGEHEKIINKLQGDKYKLEKQVEILKRELKDQNRRMPKQMIKEIVVEKPVQVRIQVPKYIPGPERIVQKIVEVEKKVNVEVKSPPEIIEKPVYIEIQKPVYLDKPIYVDKPVYVDNPRQTVVEKRVQVPVEVPVQVPFEVPFQVPVYIDRPVIDQEWMMRLQNIEEELGMVLRQNHELKSDNHRLRIDNENLRSTIDQMGLNMQILQQHNEQKNREVQYLLRNGQDYVPVPVCNESFTTRDNSFSSRGITYTMGNMPSPKAKRFYS